jgi:hypothetical protein
MRKRKLIREIKKQLKPDAANCIEAAVEVAKSAIDAMSKPSCTLDDYIDALKDVREHLGMVLDAAEGDMAKSDHEMGGDEP